MNRLDIKENTKVGSDIACHILSVLKCQIMIMNKYNDK